MNNDAEYSNSQIRLIALDKLRRLQRSPRYRSFFSLEAIDAFAKVESSALAGKSLPHGECGDSKDMK